MNKTIFIISGLGADERMFQRMNFYGRKLVYLKWITPKANESIENYAERLRAQITEINPIILGLSFGGMLAVEIAKQIPTEKIILISSIKNKKELPFLYRLYALSRVNKLLPKTFYLQTNFFVYWLFGAKTPEMKQILKTVLRDTDLDFTIWAVNAIINWKNQIVSENLWRIHGTNDHLLPIEISAPNFRIKNGGHLIVLNRADEVSLALKSILSKI